MAGLVLDDSVCESVRQYQLDHDNLLSFSAFHLKKCQYQSTCGEERQYTGHVVSL